MMAESNKIEEDVPVTDEPTPKPEQPTIKSAGDLRGFLADVLLGIRSGEVDIEKANAISKVAGQITQSLAIEAKAAIELRRLGADPEEEGVPLIAGEKWVWCEQCDARVTASEAAGCKSRFCKARGGDA